MVSSTQQSSRIRRRKQTTNGKWNKRIRRASTTPTFPIHLEGYDPNAADAKKQAGLRGLHGQSSVRREAQSPEARPHRA